MKYVSKSNENVKCIFCEALKNKEYTLTIGERAFVLLNTYPYNTGHLMVAPIRHTPSIIDLTKDELLELFLLVQFSIKILSEVYRPHGFNIGANLGEAAGAGVKDHFHVHIVPRWVGDTNFMPIIGNTKVLPELLDDTYKRLYEKFKNVKIEF